VAGGAVMCGGRVGVKPLVCTRGRGWVASARGVVPGARAGFWPLACCPTRSTGVAGDISCGVFLPGPSSPDASPIGVAAPLEIHSSSSSLPTVDAAIVKPALGLPPRGGFRFEERRGAAPVTCSRTCACTVLPVRETFTRGFGCPNRDQ
jgi:hypothetical protein